MTGACRSLVYLAARDTIDSSTEITREIPLSVGELSRFSTDAGAIDRSIDRSAEISTLPLFSRLAVYLAVPPARVPRALNIPGLRGGARERLRRRSYSGGAFLSPNIKNIVSPY
jgi:hypothetical protein